MERKINMKRGMVLLLCSAVISSVFIGCGKKQQDSVLDKVNKEGVIHVGTANNNPPMNYMMRTEIGLALM